MIRYWFSIKTQQMQMHGLYQVVRKLGFASIRFLSRMCEEPPYRDSYECTRLLQHCTNYETLKRIHAQVITGGHHQNQFVSSKLVSHYAKGSTMEDAQKVFDNVPERDVLLWNVVIRGYANSGPFMQSINTYSHMLRSGVRSNRYTFPFVLKACAAMRDSKNGFVIHGHVLRAGLASDLFVGNALVAFYAKCAESEIARILFDEMPEKDIVSWNSMISGYTQNERAKEALMLLHQMLHDDNTMNIPDHATLASLLPACAQLAAIQEGMWIHSYIVKSGMDVDVVLGSGLIAMYANCGRLEIARDLFDRIPERNVVLWNTMIRGYGMHGHANVALELFSRMVETGVTPDGISFVCILFACSHAGLVDKGWEIFKTMGYYGVEKSGEHYACMVDLLGRAGFVDEAVQFIKNISGQPGKEVWGALLGACRIHNNIELAEEVAERLFVLDPDNAGRYVLLAKMYEDAGRWEDAARVRKVMRERSVRKPLGCSAIKVDCVVHTFGVEDDSHPSTGWIKDTLEGLERVMEVMG